MFCTLSPLGVASLFYSHPSQLILLLLHFSPHLIFHMLHYYCLCMIFHFLINNIDIKIWRLLIDHVAWIRARLHVHEMTNNHIQGYCRIWKKRGGKGHLVENKEMNVFYTISFKLIRVKIKHDNLAYLVICNGVINTTKMMGWY